MGQYGLLLQSIGFLLLIAILAYLAVRYGLRSVYRGLDGGYMKVLERVPLDPRSGVSLTLVRMGQEVLLIGTAQGGVSLLARFSWEELQAIAGGESGASSGFKESFSRILENLKKNRPGQDQD